MSSKAKEAAKERAKESSIWAFFFIFFYVRQSGIIVKWKRKNIMHL